MFVRHILILIFIEIDKGATMSSLYYEQEVFIQYSGNHKYFFIWNFITQCRSMQSESYS